MREPAPRDSNTEASELRAERDRFAAFALAAADLLVEVNGDGRVVYVVGAARALTGCDARQLIGSAFGDLFAEPQRAFAQCDLFHREPRPCRRGRGHSATRPG